MHGIIDSQQTQEQNMPNISIRIVPADGLAPFGARVTTGTVITMIGPILVRERNFKM